MSEGHTRKHVALVGFMAAGKSTVGKELARRLGRALVDTDAEIERAHGPIDAIFVREGEPAFRRYEHAAVERALQSVEPIVIAVGGGALTYAPTRTLLERGAYRVFLSVSTATIVRRLRPGARPRPLLGSAPASERVEELYRLRLPLYRASDVTVECDALSARAAAGAVCDALREAGIA